MVGQLFPIASQPGIKRDGTSFAGRFYTDGQWCRFQRGLPRKMGGYKQILGGLTRPPRGLTVLPQSPNFQVYWGDSQSLQYQLMDSQGDAVGAIVDRTPIALAPSVDYQWTFDSLYVSTSSENRLVAHAATNLNAIDNINNTPVFYGNLQDNLPLTPTGFSVSGGIVSLHPYLFMFGNDGTIIISNENNPTTALNTVRVCSQKIVAGLQVRGGNSSPAGLFWSLDSLIRATFFPDSNGPNFRFDTVTDESSILSSKGIIEYDGLYFWAGVDRFLVYNGVVQEVPNQMNLNYFYKNLNYDQRQKVWATKVPEYGEIWWFYPTQGHTECNRAVIYNKRENSWYDTDITRGCGYFEQVFASPVWVDSTPDGGNHYRIWEHEPENSYDQDIAGTLTAIQSYFETGDIAWVAVGPTASWTGVDRWIDLYRVEPDFLQTGNMTMIINGREYARSPVVASNPYTFTANTLKIDTREQRREMRLRFESNEVGGFYELGQTLLYFRVGDARA